MRVKAVWLAIAGIVLFIAGFDVYLYADGIPGNSISQVIIAASDKSKLVPFFVGYLMGALTFHWFDNYTEPRNGES